MGIKIEILRDEEPTSIDYNEILEIVHTYEPAVLVEVNRGLPGVQNLFVGYTPPTNPQEGFVWIDLNG